MRIRAGSLIVLTAGLVCLLSLPAFADTVHHYTIVTVLNDHYLVTEGTKGATMLSNGTPGIDAVVGVSFIPQPSAAWAGLGLLGLLAIRRYLRRRRI